MALGEKVALYLGTSIAMWFEGGSNSVVLKVFALALLEAATDMLVEAAYAAYSFHVGTVRYNLRVQTLLAVAACGGAAVGTLFVAVRTNCLIGEEIAQALG
jgi:hypothetical protein